VAPPTWAGHFCPAAPHGQKCPCHIPPSLLFPAPRPPAAQVSRYRPSFPQSSRKPQRTTSGTPALGRWSPGEQAAPSTKESTMNATLRNWTLAVLSVVALLPLAGTASAQSYRSSYWWRHYRPHNTTGSLNQKVLSYAQGMLGKQDGNGECWTLVDNALRSAGADASGDSNYVFGQAISVGSVSPGDVIQFTRAHFVHTN